MSIELGRLAERLNQIDQTLTMYFRRDVTADCNDRLKAAADTYNDAVRRSNGELQEERKGLDRLRNQLNSLAEGIEQSARALSPDSSSDAGHPDWDRRNDLIEQHNAKVRDHANGIADYKLKEAEYQALASQRHEDLLRQEREVDALDKRLSQEFAAYQAWESARGKERFFREVNGLYASLCEAQPSPGAEAGAVRAYVNQLRTIRKELALYARRRESEAENGVLIVPALLNHTEECHLVVDTASTTVTISPEIVQALGLADRLGEEVEIVTAGGLTAKGRRLVLPSLVVQQMEARDVEAIQLPESQCGVDGLLGLSFLNRFNYMVEREKPQRLGLSVKGDSLLTYDVFISYKSDDEWWARVVFDALSVMRYRPFLSDVSLRQTHDVEFGKAIEAAISAAKHLIVVATRPEHLTSRWVEDEWRLFIHLQRTHRRAGKIVTVLCENMAAQDLPPPLSMYQALAIKERDFRDRLQDFLPLA